MVKSIEPTSQIEGLIDIQGFSFDLIKTFIAHDDYQLPSDRKTYLKLYQGLLRGSPSLVNVSVNITFKKEIVVCFYKLLKRKNKTPAPILNSPTKSSIRKYYTKILDYKHITNDMSKVQYMLEKHSNHAKQANNVSTYFIDQAERIIESHKNQGASLSKIRRSHVQTVNPLTIRPNGLSQTKTGQIAMDQIHLVVNRLPAQEKEHISLYEHPFNPYTWHKESITKGTTFGQEFLKSDSPYYIHTDGENYMKSVDDMTVHELTKHYVDTRPNLFGSFEVLSKQSTRLDKRGKTTPTEFTSFINALTENIPVDEFGFPLEIDPPELDVSLLCANGPMSTTGGVDLKGSRQTKTNLYHDTVNEAKNVAQACKDRAEEINRTQLPSKEIHHKIMLQPLFTSIKNELIKRDKKIRFFTLMPSQFELLENIVYSQILDNNKGVTYDPNGGNRLMIGTSLDRGYGTFLLQAMIKRNGEDLETLLDQLANLGDPNKMKNYDDPTANLLERAKGFVTDYTSQEFQHNLVHRALSQLASYHFYVYRREKCWFQMVMSVLGEMTMQVDADLGAGRLLILPPGHVASGCKLTLLGNGNSNKFELSHACIEGILSSERGYYYAPDLSDQAYASIKNGTWDSKKHYHKVSLDRRYDYNTICNMHSNTAFQGDDGYLATIDGEPATFEFIIKIMSDTYMNLIKPEVKNLFAVMDSKGYDTRDAADFLKLKPFLTKKSFYFIRDTAAALQKMFFPNSFPFNVITQIYASISQSYTSAGNYYSYKMAMYKCKMLSSLAAAHNLTKCDDDMIETIAMLQRKAETKNSGAIDTLLTNGFNELDFNTINENFLKPNNGLIMAKQEETAYYNVYNLSRSMLLNINASTAHFE